MTNTKFCNKCQSSKLKEAFNRNSKRSDGLQNYCISCTKGQNNSFYKTDSKRRSSIKSRNLKMKSKNRTLLRRYKYLCGCRICGIKEPIVLDLHHTDPSVKENNPSAFVNYSLQTLKAEIRKCIVLCSNCHRLVHAGKLSSPL